MIGRILCWLGRHKLEPTVIIRSAQRCARCGVVLKDRGT